MAGSIVRWPSVRGPLVRGPLVVLIVTLNVRADSCIIVLTLYRDKLPRGVIIIIIVPFTEKNSLYMYCNSKNELHKKLTNCL